MAEYLVFDDTAIAVASIAMVKRFPRDDGTTFFKVYLTGVYEALALDLKDEEASKLNKYFEEKGTIDDWLNHKE